jgi:3-oxo-5-alpha-steroid 4-dehydrogenase 1
LIHDLFSRILLVVSLIVAVIVFLALFFIAAPYGRYARQGWGPHLPNWLGWLLMESVSAITMGIMFIVGDTPRTTTLILFLLMWEIHYIHRAFIYPFTLRDKWKPMPVVVMLIGAVFNVCNAFLNGRYLFDLSGQRYTRDWLNSPYLVLGVVLFVFGFIVNRQADNILRGLRAENEQGYKIPYGGLYRYISCPNYFGEIVEWIGWAIATWSLTGLAFAIWTFANLAPRARAHHKWYHKNFNDYPVERKALLPGLW